MHGEKQVRRRLEQIELLFQQQRVGAQRDELLARDQTAHDLPDLLVDQRLAARYRHHRRATLVGGIPALLRRHAAIEDRVRIVDFSAADACEVAAEQRLEHQHQRVAFPAQPLLLDEIAADTHFLEERYCHYFSFWTYRGSACRQLGRKAELDVFFTPRQHRNRHRADTSQGIDHVVDQNFGRRGARRYAHRLGVPQPIRIQLAAVGNQVTRDPDFGADFAKPVRVGTIGGPHHQDDVHQLAEVPYRRLAVLCRIADIPDVRTLNIGKTLLKGSNYVLCVVNAEGGLGNVSDGSVGR